jgi:hypothetical protein
MNMVSSWIYLNIGVIAALIALGVVAISTAVEQAAIQDVRVIHVQEPLTGPPDTPLGFYGTPVTNIDDVQNIVGYSVDDPSYLPFGNSLKMIKVIEENREVALIFSPKDVSDSTGIPQGILGDKGFLVSYSIILEGFDVDKWIEQFVVDAPDVRKRVTINGMPGEANDRSLVIDPYGTEMRIPAQVIFFKERFQINLVGYFPVNELIKIASSIPLENINDMSSELSRNIKATPEMLEECKQLSIPEFRCSEKQILAKRRIVNIDFYLEPEKPEQDYIVLKKGETKVIPFNLIAPSEASLHLRLSVVHEYVIDEKLPAGLSATLDKSEILLSAQPEREQFAVREKVYLTLTADREMKEGLYELVLQAESSDGRGSGKNIRVQVQ